MIQMTNIHKSFGTNKVLQGVDFTLKEGTVHALMGENGAGKSTLMKVLVGIHQKDQGTLTYFDQPITFDNPKQAEAEGITFIHQELNIWPELTVLENLFVGKEKRNALGFLDQKAMRAQAKHIFDTLDFHIPFNKLAKYCSIGEQQMIEIAKALMTDAKMIIMDEPTATLTDTEIQALFKLMRRLKSQGVAFVYISHRMAEIFEISDEITVMRDGKTVLYRATTETSYPEIVRAMVGRDIDEQYPTRDYVEQSPVLEVEDLNHQDYHIEHAAFHLNEGEILGVSGLMGAGRTEMMRSLFGIDKNENAIKIRGKAVKISSPQDAMAHGLAMITERRKDEGLILDFSIRDNMVLPSLKSFAKYGFVDTKSTKAFVKTMQDRLNIKGDDERPVAALSRGEPTKSRFS